MIADYSAEIEIAIFQSISNANVTNEDCRQIAPFNSANSDITGAIVNRINSEVYGLNVSRILRNVEMFIISNLLKSELRYCNSFPNGSATK